jgi:hypothetical protein
LRAWEVQETGSRLAHITEAKGSNRKCVAIYGFSQIAVTQFVYHYSQWQPSSGKHTSLVAATAVPHGLTTIALTAKTIDIQYTSKQCTTTQNNTRAATSATTTTMTTTTTTTTASTTTAIITTSNITNHTNSNNDDNNSSNNDTINNGHTIVNNTNQNTINTYHTDDYNDTNNDNKHANYINPIISQNITTVQQHTL